MSETIQLDSLKNLGDLLALLKKRRDEAGHDENHADRKRRRHFYRGQGAAFDEIIKIVLAMLGSQDVPAHKAVS